MTFSLRCSPETDSMILSPSVLMSDPNFVTSDQPRTELWHENKTQGALAFKSRK